MERNRELYAIHRVKVYFIHIQVILVLLPNMLREKIVFLSLC